MFIYEKDLSDYLITIKKEFNKIVFTNGVFDILHKGHVDYLNSAKHEGDYLIVGINSDFSVKQIKGPQRPINSQEDRAFIISNLKSVDLCIIFDDLTPYSLIETILPNVLIKGGDYDENETNPSSSKYIIGSDLIKSRGGKIITVPLTKNRSTTNTINKISIKKN